MKVRLFRDPDMLRLGQELKCEARFISVPTFRLQFIKLRYGPRLWEAAHAGHVLRWSKMASATAAGESSVGMCLPSTSIRSDPGISLT